MDREYDPSPSYRLAAVRKLLGLSQTQAAAYYGVSRVTVARWESGESAPRNVAAIARASAVFLRQNLPQLIDPTEVLRDLLEVGSSTIAFEFADELLGRVRLLEKTILSPDRTLLSGSEWGRLFDCSASILSDIPAVDFVDGIPLKPGASVGQALEWRLRGIQTQSDWPVGESGQGVSEADGFAVQRIRIEVDTVLARIKTSVRDWPLAEVLIDGRGPDRLRTEMLAFAAGESWKLDWIPQFPLNPFPISDLDQGPRGDPNEQQ